MTGPARPKAEVGPRRKKREATPADAASVAAGGAGVGRTPGHDRSETATTPELIAQELRRLIVNGEVVSGGVLQPISHLMPRFGVSRPTLRNALRILESDNLVTVKKGSRRGAQVLQPTLDAAGRIAAQTLQATGATLGDLYEAQLMFEPGAARVLAQRRDSRDVVQLRSALRRLEALVEQKDPAPVAAELARFHHLVVELTGNKMMSLISGLVANILERHQSASSARVVLTPEMAAQSLGVRSIRKLLGFIEAGDAEAAEQHWRLHVKNANEHWLKVQDRFETINIFG